MSCFVVSDQEKAAEAEPKAEPRARGEKSPVRPLLQLPVAKPRRRASDEANDKVPYQVHTLKECKEVSLM